MIMAALKSSVATLLISCAALSFANAAYAESTYQPGYSRTTKCFRDEYREEYVPGTQDNPGYVRNWTEKVEIACTNSSAGTSYNRSEPFDTDNNDCSQGSVIGGLLGAGLGAALSRDEGRWVGIPVGVAAGAMVGCQVDGG